MKVLAKVKQLLKDKSDLKQLYTKVKTELNKAKDTIFSLLAKANVAISKREQLIGKLQAVDKDKVAAHDRALDWDVTCNAQIEYINHLIFFLCPHMDKLTKDLATKITVMPGKVRVVFKPVDRRATKATPVDDTTSITEGIGACKVNVGEVIVAT